MLEPESSPCCSVLLASLLNWIDSDPRKARENAARRPSIGIEWRLGARDSSGSLRSCTTSHCRRAASTSVTIRRSTHLLHSFMASITSLTTPSEIPTLGPAH
jgi:hypothetical protein